MSQVKTIKICGKPYVEVAERVRLVHESGRKFEVVESVPHQVGDRCLWRVIVVLDSHQYVGNAEVKLNATKGTPDGTNPFECAETSALGRALAFAGFGSVESIASFDEVARAITTEKPATDEQIARLRKAYQMLGRGEFDAIGLTAAAANELIEQLRIEYAQQVKKAS